MRWPIPPHLYHFLTSPTPKSLPQITQLHTHLLTLGHLHPSSPYLLTKLLQLYADADSLPSALHLFSILPSPPSVFAWTPILAALSRSPSLRPRCLSAYSRMRASSVSPDSYLFPVVLRADPPFPSAIHADAVKFACDASLHVSNALISAYSDVSDLISARKVFDLIPADQRDRLSWNSIIAAYAAAGEIAVAMGILGEMELDGWDADLVTWNTLMDGYCRAGNCLTAVELFERIKKPNVISWTIIILGQARCGNHEAALELFRRMMINGDVPPDQETLSCVVSSCRHVAASKSGREVQAFGVKTMRASVFYRAAGAALVSLYAACGRISAAELVFLRMDPTDVVTWNALIAGLVRAGDGEAAIEKLRVMRSRGIGGDETTLAAVLPACDLKCGKEIHAHVTRNYYGSAIPIHSALIAVYSKWGCIQAARSVFRAMLRRDVVTWNAMIGAYGSHGLGRLAVDLVREMNRMGPRPDAVTLTCALAACSHSGLVGEGIELFESLGPDLESELGMEHYAGMVDLLGRAGRLEEAVRFIRGMPVGPDGSVWGALMAASRVHGNVEFGRLAFEELVRVEPKNAGNYVTMSGIYVRAGRWEEARMVRESMGRRGAVKPSGYSWIEAG